MTYIFNEYISPAANYEASVTLEQALKSDQPSFKQQNIYYPEYREEKTKDGGTSRLLARLFYADEFDGKKMKGLTIIDRSQAGVNQIVVSESAQWNAYKQVWDFYNGTIYLVAPDRSYRNILRFEHQQLQLPSTPLIVAKNSRDYEEMNIAQSLQQLEIEKLAGNPQRIKKLEVRIQQKIAFPFICIIFGLVGSAMGTIPQRTGRGRSFGVSIIVIFIYYLLLSVCGALAQAEILSPFVGAWLPNLCGLGMGILILMQFSQK
jgi:lipopolysaccharide export system permease protein